VTDHAMGVDVIWGTDMEFDGDRVERNEVNLIQGPYLSFNLNGYDQFLWYNDYDDSDGYWVPNGIKIIINRSGKIGEMSNKYNCCIRLIWNLKHSSDELFVDCDLVYDRETSTLTWGY
jgi:hypothetical protein